MDKAYHPISRQHFTVQKYKNEFGPRLDANGKKRQRPRVVCYTCDHAVHTVGEDLPARAAHWAHNRSRVAPWCPLKQRHARLYELLPDGTEVSDQAAAELRASFFRNWRSHWACLQNLVKVPNIHTFIGFIRWMDERRLWHRRDLLEWYLPYICAATCEFPPPRSTKGKAQRSVWLRFFFDARVRTVDDLWIRTTGDFRLMKAVYQLPPRAKQPGPKYLVETEAIMLDPDFLSKPVARSASDYEVVAMLTALGVS